MVYQLSYLILFVHRMRPGPLIKCCSCCCTERARRVRSSGDPRHPGAAGQDAGRGACEVVEHGVTPKAKARGRIEPAATCVKALSGCWRAALASPRAAACIRNAFGARGQNGTRAASTRARPGARPCLDVRHRRRPHPMQKRHDAARVHEGQRGNELTAMLLEKAFAKRILWLEHHLDGRLGSLGLARPQPATMSSACDGMRRERHAGRDEPEQQRSARASHRGRAFQAHPESYTSQQTWNLILRAAVDAKSLIAASGNAQRHARRRRREHRGPEWRAAQPGGRVGRRARLLDPRRARARPYSRTRASLVQVCSVGADPAAQPDEPLRVEGRVGERLQRVEGQPAGQDAASAQAARTPAASGCRGAEFAAPASTRSIYATGRRRTTSRCALRRTRAPSAWSTAASPASLASSAYAKEWLSSTGGSTHPPRPSPQRGCTCRANATWPTRAGARARAPR